MFKNQANNVRLFDNNMPHKYNMQYVKYIRQIIVKCRKQDDKPRSGCCGYSEERELDRAPSLW